MVVARMDSWLQIELQHVFLFAEDPFYELRIIDEADNLHFIRASGTTERVRFPIPAFAGTSLYYEIPPGLGRHPPWPMIGDIQHGHLGFDLRSRRLIAGPQ
jgi:hypothetical protein